MKKSVWIVLAIIVVLVVGIWVFAATKDKDTANDSSNNTTGSSSEQSTSQEESNNNDVALSEVTVTYTDTGFQPESVTLAVGGQVMVKNESSETLAFRSDPHPVHTENDELNIEDIAPGGTGSFTVSKKGTWGFHNHLDPDRSGVIVAE